MIRGLLRSLLLLCSVSVLGQNIDVEALTGFQYNFGNPGARSLGMGGAFLALADDATAAESNPAGLTTLTRPEVSIEGRRITSRTQAPTGGQFGNITYSSREETQQVLSFASAVVPIGGFTFAGYYHNPLREDTVDSFGEEVTFGIDASNNPVPNCTGLVGCSTARLPLFGAERGLRLSTYGLAVARRFGGVSVGATLRYQSLKENVRSNYADPRVGGTGNVYGQISDDKDVTFSTGLKWANPSGRLGIGAVYKQGAEFDTNIVFGPPLATVSEAGPPFHVPHVYGAGVMIRPLTALTVTFDAVRVTYSHQADAFRSGFSARDQQAPGAFNINDEFRSNDATELHLGAEYAITTLRSPLLFRAGVWRDPAHGTHFTGDTRGASVNETYARTWSQILFPAPTEDAMHYSLGLGVRFKKIQIDGAYDMSDVSGDTGSISLVTQF